MLLPESSILNVPLSTHEQKALQLLGVSTIADFLQLDLQKIFTLRGYGATTYAGLQKKRDWLQCLNAEFENDVNYDNQHLLQKSIRSLGLSSRGEATLRQLKVKTVGAFLSLDLSKMDRHLTGCGKGTQQLLTAVQAELRSRFIPEGQRNQPDQNETILYFTKQPVSLYSWRKLPLFLGRPIPDLAAGELHPSYHPECPIDQLAFSKHVKQVFAERHITSLGELLLTPGLELTKSNRFREGALRQTQAHVDEYLLYSFHGSSTTELDWSTHDGFLLSLVGPVIVDTRQRQVLLERMGWQSASRTLKALGHEFGLTRERIRQIENAGMNRLLHWRSVAVLKPLHDLILAAMEELSPLASFRAMGGQLQQRLGWDRPLSEKLLAKIVSIFKDLRCVEDQYLCVAGLRCINCPLLPMALETILADGHPKRIHLSALAPLLLKQIHTREDCQACEGRPEQMSTDLVRFAFSRSSAAASQYQLVEDDQTTEDVMDDAILILREGKK